MEQLVTSDFKLGIIAGGQLGKMLALAASKWDVKTYVLDHDEHCPASTVCTAFVKGNRLDFDDVYKFGQMVDMITFEIESINIEALKELKRQGKRINPDPEILEIIQDKGLQKEYYRKHHIPTPDYRIYKSKNEIIQAVRSGEFSLPLVQKLRTGGYDGRGVAVIHAEKNFGDLLDGPSVIEHFVHISKEISVIVARNNRGEIKSFPAVEMDFNEDANLVDRLICPSTLDDKANSRAVEIAEKLIAALNVSGLLAVEMFIDANYDVWVNEVAPRPHNSGHHTIESIITSQYEQLLRAIFNFSLGSTLLKMPSVMINLLGESGYEGPVKYEGLTECMGIEGVKIHLYGKKTTRPFRKMGHVTVLAKTIEEAKVKADLVKQKLKVKSW
jgi:5-(carboxyamino)imidazole ribonucleotide synthase